MTPEVVSLEAIAEACRPMAACLLASLGGQTPSAADLAEALEVLQAARRAPGRIGWAVGILLEGKTTGSRFAQAADIVIRVAGYSALPLAFERVRYEAATYRTYPSIQPPRIFSASVSPSNPAPHRADYYQQMLPGLET
jgi:hypothetical protein